MNCWDIIEIVVGFLMLFVSPFMNGRDVFGKTLKGFLVCSSVYIIIRGFGVI